ncbi:MAG: hypothetical protein ACRYFS_06820 [Janthinobacterium lividum]
MILLNPRVVLVCVGIAFAVLAVASLRYFSQYQPLQSLTGHNMMGGTAQIALEADDVQVVGRDSGKVRWRMAAQTVTLSRDRRVITVSGIRRGALYAADGKPDVSLTADQATYTTPFGMLSLGSEGFLRVSGNVLAHVLTAAHPQIKTQQIVWNSVSNELSCTVAVTATLPRLTVTAGNAAYDSTPGAPAHGTMRLGGGVHALFNSSRGLATLDCLGLTWIADQQTAQTIGQVTALIPGGLGTASAASIEVNTHTGDLTGHGLRGTLLLSHEVQ